VDVGLDLEEMQVTQSRSSVSWTGWCSAPQCGQANRVPEAKTRRKSTRPGSGLQATSTTSQGAGRLSSKVNNDNGSMMKPSDVWP